MATQFFLPNLSCNYSSLNHLTCSKNNNFSPISHSSSQVCLPNKSTESVIPSSSSVASVSSFSCSKQRFSYSSSSSASVFSETNDTNSNNNNSSLVHQWREIQGCNNWDGLVEPLHPLLQQEIIRYGEFVTACYKAFDLDPNSKRYLSCKYGKKNMLNQVGMENSGYTVTKYIYATPDVSIPIQNDASCGRWIGYVAVSTDDESVKKLGRRDIVITFRGTVTNHEWVANFMSALTPARLDPHNLRPAVKVELGFLNLYTSGESNTKFGLQSCRQQLLSEVSRLINKYKDEEISISIAGHSMGSSLAVLLAYDISELGLNNRVNINNPKGDIPVTVFSFGGPRVGNAGFKERCEEIGVKVLRIVNVNDPITKLPGVFLNENFRVLGGKFEFYAHVGVELVLDFFNMQNPSCVHDLESYIKSLLMKCPYSKKRSSSSSSSSSSGSNIDQDHHLQDRDRVNFFNRVKYLLFSAQNFNVNKIMNIIVSQNAEMFLLDENILGWMNSLALYSIIFL